MFSKAIATLMFLAAVVPGSAYAQAGAGFTGAPEKDPYVCQSGREVWTEAGLHASAGYEACNSTNVGETAPYKAIRVDPGRAQVPHEIYGVCFYIDNYSNNSFFVPAKTPAEFASFVDHHPQLIELVPCCPSTTPVADTCGGSLDRTIRQRPGYTEEHMVGLYNGRQVTLQCQETANGRSAQWDLAADEATPCDYNVADAAEPGTRVAVIQGRALIRNIPID